MRRYSVVICTVGSRRTARSASSIARGSISGSSPCTLTTTSQSSDAATSAQPIGAGLVRRLASAAPCRRSRATRVAMRKIVGGDDDLRRAAARRRARYTCSIIGRPSRSASALPGSRVEAYRAGMTATTLSGGTESTLEPVDAGCTTNNSTTLKSACYDRRSYRMNLEADDDDCSRWRRTSPRGSRALPRRITRSRRPSIVQHSGDRNARRGARRSKSSGCTNACDRRRRRAQPGRNLFTFRAARARTGAGAGRAAPAAAIVEAPVERRRAACR